MRKLLSSTILLAGLAVVAIPAQAGDDLSVTTTVDYVTDYVFRGVSLADSAIQSGVEVGAGDFYAGAWFSTGIGDTSLFAADELDLYAGYGFTLSDSVSADVGVTYYHYPQGGGLFDTKGGAAGTYEVYGGLSFDTTLSPSVYGYYDFTLEAFTVEGAVGHSIETGEATSLDLGLTAGLVDGDGFSWEYAQASASLGYALSDNVSAYVAANYAINSDSLLNYEDCLFATNGCEANLLFFGAGVSAGF